MTDIAKISKNSREELRVTLDEFRGHHLLNARDWFDAGEEMRPGKQGIAVKVELLPALIEALQKAEREATRQGLIGERAA